MATTRLLLEAAGIDEAALRGAAGSSGREDGPLNLSVGKQSVSGQRGQFL